MSRLIKQKQQLPSHLVMVRPLNFGFNNETAASNRFQSNQGGGTEGIKQNALDEFDKMVSQLRRNGLVVDIYEDTPEPLTPDAVFPNNWVSFHENGKVLLYPMMAENRRLERRMDIIEAIAKHHLIDEVIDLSYFEREGLYLEGTGSMVLDRQFAKVYACLSPRTDKKVLEKIAVLLGYELLCFCAEDESGTPVYHTNVLMSLGEGIAVICLEAFTREGERNSVVQSLTEARKVLVEITLEQVGRFAGNMLFVRNLEGEKLLVLSTSAANSLSTKQKDMLSQDARLVSVTIPTIETYGGGSVRCMMAEQFLPSYKG